MCVFMSYDGGTLFLAGQREGVLPHTGELPGSQQSDGGGVHPVHTGWPHAQRQSGREGRGRFHPVLTL